MNSRRSERGQAMVLTLVFLTVLLAMSAAVIDVGAWYRAHRAVQATADASALAAVTSLPEDTSEASTLALDYAGRNGAGVTGGDVVFSTTLVANDTVEVTARRTVQGLFASLFGIGSVTARAHAKAQSSVLGQAKYAAPIGVDIKHPLLQCEPLPCFDQQTQLDLEKTGPGAFRLINIDGSRAEPARTSWPTGCSMATTATCRSTGTSRTRARSSTLPTFKPLLRPGLAASSSSPCTTTRGGRARTSSTRSSDGSASI